MATEKRSGEKPGERETCNAGLVRKFGRSLAIPIVVVRRDFENFKTAARRRR